MEFSVTQENLSRALSAVGRVASSRAGLPILGNILFRTEGNRLLVAATNLEIAATYYVGAKVTTQGSLTIPARLVSEFVSSLPKSTITISTKGTMMTIVADNYSSKIGGVDAEEFPELPTIDEKEAVVYGVATADFKHAVTQTIIATSSDTSRPVLTGVYWHAVDGILCLAGTDGYRLAERKLLKTKSEVSAIIPSSSLSEVMRTITDSVEEIEVLFDDTQVRFRVGDAEITSRLIDGKYPDYRQLIPSKSDTTITVSTNELTRIVKIASLFARESGGSITLHADAETKTLGVRSVASEIGENTSTIDAEITQSGEITLNARYVTEALGVTDGDMISLRFSGKLSPCVLSTPEKDTNYTHIIMPLKS